MGPWWALQSLAHWLFSENHFRLDCSFALHDLLFPLTLTLFLVCLHLSVLCFISSVELFPILTLQWKTDGIGFTSICGPLMNSEVVVVGILRLRRHYLFSERHHVLHEWKGFVSSLNKNFKSVSGACLTWRIFKNSPMNRYLMPI